MKKICKKPVEILSLSVLTIFCCSLNTSLANSGKLFSDVCGVDSSSAKIVINKKEINVGAVTKDSLDRVYTVVVKNGGNAPLKIKDISTSCFCTLVDCPKKNILPGDSACIDVTLLTREMSYAEIFVREIYVNTNDPSTPCDTISITGSVVR